MKKYIEPLLAEGKLEMTIPDKPSSRKQKFVIKFEQQRNLNFSVFLLSSQKEKD